MNKRWLWFVIPIVLLFFLVVGLGAGWWYLHNRIFPNVRIAGVDMGFQTEDQARSTLQTRTEPFPLVLDLVSPVKTYRLDLSALQFHWDIETTIHQAYGYGRYSKFIPNIGELQPLLKAPQDIPVTIQWQEAALQATIASIAAELDEPEIPPTLTILTTGTTRIASASAGRTGKQLNQLNTITAIKESILKVEPHPITLILEEATPAVSPQQLAHTQQYAQHLIGKNLFLNYQSSTWQLQDEELVNFLSFTATFDEPKIASWSAQLAQIVNRPPQNALFEFEGNKVKEFQPAKPGLAVDQAKTIQAIKQGIMDLANTTGQSHQTVALSVVETQPDITTDRVNNLGIRELIGKGESWYSHSIPGRVHNVALATSKIHGQLVAPGETFSFVKAVGEIDAANGYKSAYIIQNGRTVLGDGGGVCQVSTTLFRAALSTGLEIVERNAHAYRVGYYEENSDPGIDATIFSPSVDFKFKNDTPAHILIQSVIDTNKYYLAFEMYGTSDGRQATISKSRLWNQVPPPPDRYQDDPSLPPGVVKQVDWKAWGANVSFDWKVTKDGQTLHEKTFYSNYKPWQAVFMKGPNP